MTALIGIGGVEKAFGPVTALAGIELEIRENEFFALLGPSGCGKTTLLRILAGFETPDRGRITLDGKDLIAIPPNRRPINMMFQSYALFPHMTVEGNVAYGLEMEGVRGAELKRRAAEALALVQLEGVAGRKPHLLSGGQRQRVALARALVKRPRLLLLDEPLAALDKKLRDQMRLELKRLQHGTGITFLIVTHDQEEALVMADRIALMDQGRIAQLGSPRALYEEPASRFVADFIGVTNLIEGRVAAQGFAADGLSRLLPAPPGVLAAGTPAALAIRPERIRVRPAAATASGQGLEGRIESIAYLGQDLILHVRVAGLVRPLVARLGTGLESLPDMTEGASVTCDWTAERARLLTN
ncbi:polyamine-transporting ATPase [Hypericibacter adhaerens]|jgi:spermidine/putrescine transport system ATP-binding protein/putrescine transport system ATP-binding protein|uniref:Spermidine/putrescine import ATP-binding protein PotA n=1 Tax=Hypericibacter adhaerens TaxID=2602016 RepID=A0A5J6N5Z5_9PROT|nr:ABC transporter ATP-binding protein [Hypericibacter adhaerens]QEX24844.1 polyamine-transporting ATPase [Hypericibacter adhaerens]